MRREVPYECGRDSTGRGSKAEDSLEQVVRLRLSEVAPAALAQTNGGAAGPFGDKFEATLQARH